MRSALMDRRTGWRAIVAATAMALILVAGVLPSATVGSVSTDAKTRAAEVIGRHLDEISECWGDDDADACLAPVLADEAVGIAGIGFMIAAIFKFKCNNDYFGCDLVACIVDGGTFSSCLPASTARSIERQRSIRAIALALDIYAIAKERCGELPAVCTRPGFWPTSWPWNISA